MSIEVLKAGIADSIQDAGRYGYQFQGINPAGVMDPLAAMVANYLVGNPAGEAVIELHFPAAVLQFGKTLIGALSGGDFSASIHGVDIPLNTPFLIAKGDILQFTHLNQGARCYLALRRGLTIEPWLNSKSTHSAAAIGGWCGRFLKKGDVLPVQDTTDYAEAIRQTKEKTLPWKLQLQDFYRPNLPIRLLAGHEWELLQEESKLKIQNSAFTISAQSNRMAYRLQGGRLQTINPVSMLSSAVTKGTLQLLPNGQLALLMADHQTTGGYPRIAHVISADLPVLAQTGPLSSIHFTLVSQHTATQAFKKQQDALYGMQKGCDLQLNRWLINFSL